MKDSSQMSESQQQEIEEEYNSLQNSFSKLMDAYKNHPDSLTSVMQYLYSQMQSMHQQLDENHHHMMRNHQHGNMSRGSEDNNYTGQQMHLQMQNNITAEWYNQMIGFHKEMREMHSEMGHQSMAELHQVIKQRYQKLMSMVPRINQSDDTPSNTSGDPKILNGKGLYSQNCASCHGENGQGLGNSFPPVTNTKWITGDKSVPVRVIRDGLAGKIDVRGSSYDGNMPAFKARLSNAEIAAILNYLRDQSEGDHPQVTQDEIIEIGNRNSNRTAPWSPEELIAE